MLHHIWGMLAHPRKEWEDIDAEIRDHGYDYILHLLVLGAIPSVASYIGATHVGWTLTGLDPVRLTPLSALVMSLMSYFAIIGATVTIGLFAHWMSKTFGSKASYQRCIMFAAYVGTPLYLSGLAALYPSTPLSLTVIIAAIAYAVYLLYIGMPKVMDIPFEQGFLFASSLVCSALVVLVVMKVATAIAWQLGLGPVFEH